MGDTLSFTWFSMFLNDHARVRFYIVTTIGYEIYIKQWEEFIGEQCLHSGIWVMSYKHHNIMKHWQLSCLFL